jgi:peptidoglycan/xylan/chitin deacetylase (PgdA/CDA1 family)
VVARSVAGEEVENKERHWRRLEILFAWFCLIVFSAVFIYFGVPFLYGRLARLKLRRKAVQSNALVLSFDDGPGNRLTTAIMTILAEHNVKASFFLLGKNVLGREDLVRHIADEGHEICSHGYDHLNYWKVSPFKALSDIKRGWEAIDSALGGKQKTYPFRPPNGRLNIICLLYLLFRNVPIVYWLADSGDTWPEKPDNQWIADIARRTGGTVSLAHDFDRRNLDTEQYVLDSTRSALVAAKECGMKIVTISELVESR